MARTPPYRFGNLLALARKSWIEQVGERMQEAGFPGYRRSDAAVLACLLQRPLAIGQLGEALGVTRQAARQLADGLAERGYASFGTDEADARRTLVLLTPRGKAYGRAIWMAQDALNERVRGRVTEADLAAADAVLRAVFPDDGSRQRIDERMPPPGKLSGESVKVGMAVMPQQQHHLADDGRAPDRPPVPAVT
jgi:DNA-binding MarR family transcriptional regulator